MLIVPGPSRETNEFGNKSRIQKAAQVKAGIRRAEHGQHAMRKMKGNQRRKTSLEPGTISQTGAQNGGRATGTQTRRDEIKRRIRRARHMKGNKEKETTGNKRRETSKERHPEREAGHH